MTEKTCEGNISACYMFILNKRVLGLKDHITFHTDKQGVRIHYSTGEVITSQYTTPPLHQQCWRCVSKSSCQPESLVHIQAGVGWSPRCYRQGSQRFGPEYLGRLETLWSFVRSIEGLEFNSPHGQHESVCLIKYNIYIYEKKNLQSTAANKITRRHTPHNNKKLWTLLAAADTTLTVRLFQQVTVRKPSYIISAKYVLF